MKKLDLKTGGHPYRLNDLVHVQNGLIEVIEGIANGFNDGDNFIINGCEVTSAINNDFNSGFIYFNGEVFKVESGTAGPTPVGEQLFWNIVETTENPEDLSSPYQVTYQDSVDKDVHLVRNMTLQNGVTGDFPAANAPRIFHKLTAGGTMPVGTITMWSGSVSTFDGTGKGFGELTGWALCNGNNSTPDLRGKFVVGYDPGDTDYDTIGETGGEKEHQLTEDELPEHSHTGLTDNDGAHSHTIIQNDNDSGDSNRFGNVNPSGNDRNGSTETDGAHSHSFTTDNTGGDQPHENRPPYYTIAYIMRIV